LRLYSAGNFREAYKYSRMLWKSFYQNPVPSRNNICELNQSHIGHFNEVAALRNESSTTFNGKVSSWDWTEIQATSRKLKYQVHNKLATRKIGSFGVLSGADKLEKAGAVLR
jgi:hypothetical protein